MILVSDLNCKVATLYLVYELLIRLQVHTSDEGRIRRCIDARECVTIDVGEGGVFGFN